jgi:hypothetical protein
VGLLETLTVVFIVLKLLGIITWSWLAVFSPVLIAVALYLLWVLVMLILIKI